MGIVEDVDKSIDRAENLLHEADDILKALLHAAKWEKADYEDETDEASLELDDVVMYVEEALGELHKAETSMYVAHQAWSDYKREEY